MVKHRRTKKYGITDGVSPLSSEFFLSDSSVLSLRSSSCGQNCGGNRHVYANYINFLSRIFWECTEAVATSLMPLATYFPEICAFIIGFSFTAWTKKRSFRAN